MRLIDIGCNLADERLYQNYDQIIQEAANHHVEQQIITGSDWRSNEIGLILAKKYPWLHTTIGFHPHHADEWIPSRHTNLLYLATKNPLCVAVGEMGLDYFRNISKPINQKQCFINQLEVAIAVKKPIFLHCRDAVTDFIKILTPYHAYLDNKIWHCFTEDKAALTWAIDNDYYIGITGWICDPKRGEALRDLVKDIPNNRLLIETDAPYLTPKTIQPTPKTNQPKYLIEVLKMIASCKKMDIETLGEITYKNTLEAFRI